MRIIDPHARLRELAAGRGVHLTELSRMIDRPARYLGDLARRSPPAPIEDDDRATLAVFFGVSEMELGGDAPHWSERRARRAA